MLLNITLDLEIALIMCAIPPFISPFDGGINGSIKLLGLATIISTKKNACKQQAFFD